MYIHRRDRREAPLNACNLLQARHGPGSLNRIPMYFTAVVSSAVIAMQNYAFTLAASSLTTKLRILSFRAVVFQDLHFSGNVESNIGELTPRRQCPAPNESRGPMPITMKSIMQTVTTLVIQFGSAYTWKPALVAMDSCLYRLPIMCRLWFAPLSWRSFCLLCRFRLTCEPI
ncbi:hypothetical protein EDC04DRAFT_2672301 [Pisolithus marmoratus]|nr:hypothetical protein EDC04DRAFT_2672301 [Pisolithus marmoratus]